MYPSAAALVAASSGDARAALEQLDADQLEGYRAAAIAAIEEFCGQTFDTAVRSVVSIDGAGADTLYLPRRLSELYTIAVSGTGLGPTDIVVSEDRASISLAPTGGNAYTRTMATLEPDYDPRARRFTRGTGTVQIDGLWGWADAEFPTPVGLAMRYDIEDNALADSSALSSTVHAYRALGLRDIAQGNLRATIQGPPGLSMRAQRTLWPYVWEPIGQAV